MKRINGLVLIPTVALLFIVGWLIGRANFQNSQPVQAQETSPDRIDIQALKDRLGLDFVPVDQKTIDAGSVKITEEDAVAKAQESGAPVKGATAVTAELGYLSNPSLEELSQTSENVDTTLLARPLVWIISFHGLESYSAGEPGTGGGKIAHEYNVVIDATTGERLMGFIYR